MKLKGIKLSGTYKIRCYATYFEIYNEKGKVIYFEDNNDYWTKWKYDEKGNVIYHEDSEGYWSKRKYDEKGNAIYFENSSGYWDRWKYNEKGNDIYHENSDGYWSKGDYDEKGNEIYYENSNGKIIDRREKELTIEEIEKLLGYKIKIIGNEGIDKNMNAEQEGADFYGATKYSEKADDILFALQVMYGEPKYTYRDFQKMNLSQTEINNALAYLKKKGYNKFSFFEKY
ncbi:hypothetical protein [Methanoculleus sp.]|uniref:hypothetical protein n=1 Tax=Methanoculleus sp. TaxID=90427 RepID=UPI0025E25215|nr:hypothetical protein [Methanoculleus sp.]MCK9320356.1 hypothetical protein [Methanoculleus sp.]